MLNKKLFTLFLTAVLLVGTVSAMTNYEQSIYNQIDNLFTKIQYGLNHGLLGLFSSAGQAAGCSIYPDWSGYIKQGNSVSCSKVSATRCAIDSWLASWTTSAGATGVIWDTYLGETGPGTSSFVCNYPYCYSEIYACPTTAPIIETHSTTAYKCQSGNWNIVGTYGINDYCSYAGSLNGNKCYCSSASNNFYIDQNGGVHCQPSTYSSVNDGTWCKITTTSTQPTTCISRDTLGIKINSWIAGTITRDALGTAIQSWAGC